MRSQLTHITTTDGGYLVSVPFGSQNFEVTLPDLESAVETRNAFYRSHNMEIPKGGFVLATLEVGCLEVSAWVMVSVDADAVYDMAIHTLIIERDVVPLEIANEELTRLLMEAAADAYEANN